MKDDYRTIETVLRRNGVPPVVPLYEHGIDDTVVEKVMGWDFSGIDPLSADGKAELWKRRIEFYRQVGYGYVPVELPPKFARIPRIKGKDTALYAKGDRMWADERSGVIKTMEDLENPDYWPDAARAFDYGLFDRIASLLPEDMKIIGGISGGVFEYATALAGLEELCIKVYDEPDFSEKLFQRIGSTFTEVARRLVRSEKLCGLRMGDDLGFKNGTFFSPEMLRKYVFPWHKKMAEIAHQAGLPFVLHCCGNVESVMEDLISHVGVDAKHSFEDVILPVTEVKKKWGGRIALLGGVDMDFLCRSTPGEVGEYTKRMAEICSRGGGFAIGSGNSISNYVPVANYLAMVRAAEEFNGG